MKLWSALENVIPARVEFNSKMQDYDYDFLIEAMILKLVLAASKEKTKEIFKTKLSLRAVRCMNLVGKMA